MAITLNEIFASNVRPPTDVRITLLGEDASGNEINLEWNSSNIVNMSLKKHIDPTGQTLPYMELVWKEFYFGKLNSHNYPEKYENIVKHMKVYVGFSVKITENISWGDVKNETWEDWSGDTWREMAKNEYNSRITKEFPFFLDAKPTIEGHTITWSAKDCLTFLNSNVETAFKGVPYKNPLKWLLLNEEIGYVKSGELFHIIHRSAVSLDVSSSDNSKDLNELVVLKGSTKELLRNYASIRNYYLDFDDGGGVLVKKFDDLINKSSPVFSFTTKIMKSFPKLTPVLTLSAYEFKSYYSYLDSANTVQKEVGENGIRTDVAGKSYMYGEYDYGTLGTSNLSVGGYVISKKGYYIGSPTLGAPDAIIVTPLATNSIQGYILNRNIGEVYVEDNPVNPYDRNSDFIWDRLDVLEDWYSDGLYSMEVDSLSNFSLDTGDLVQVETNLYNNSGVALTKKAIIVGIEFEYDGTLKQKTFLHEVE